MSVEIEGVTVKELLEWMREPVPVDEAEYQEYRTEQLERKPRERPKRRDDYISGSDFKSYWTCVRRLFWDTHDPITKRGIVNKSYFTAIKKHDLIEERLEKRGWSGEFRPEMWLDRYQINGFGHMDSLSPTGMHFLEIKHNPPTLADELQAAWYQYIHPQNPVIVLVYRERVAIIPNHRRLINKYIPRVAGTVIHDVLPPLHPNFPKCRGTCDYAPRCGRKKRVPMRTPVPQEWIDYFVAIGASTGAGRR